MSEKKLDPVAIPNQSKLVADIYTENKENIMADKNELSYGITRPSPALYTPKTSEGESGEEGDDGDPSEQEDLNTEDGSDGGDFEAN